MSDQQTEQLNQDIDNTDVDSSDGSEKEPEVEHELVLVEEESSTPNDENKPFSNAAAAQRRVQEREARKTVVKENDKIAELQRQNVEIMQQLQRQQLQPAQQADKGPAPTINDCGWDQELHTEAVEKWLQGGLPPATINTGGAQVDVGKVVTDALSKYQNSLSTDQKNTIEENKFSEHYVRASKLKGISDYVPTEELAMSHLGDNLAQSIQLDIPNSEMVLYHLGKNPKEAMRIKNLFDFNPTQATIELGVMSGKLHMRPKTTRAVEPETRLTGGTGGATKKHYPDTAQGNHEKRRADALKGSSWS